MGTTVSVVLPVYNEAENLDLLVGRLTEVLERATGSDFEVLFVDDGSTDASPEMLDALAARDPRCKVIHFSRNFGHQAALQAGLDAAGGDAGITMDADLQDPPQGLARLLARGREGYDVVYAIRPWRKDGLLKRGAYATFYRSLRAVAEIDVPLDAGDFCILDRRVARALVSLTERGRFLRGLRSWVGFRQVGIEYERAARHAGAPKYGFRKLVRLAVSGYVGFSTMPLRLATWLGFLAASAGFLIAAWAALTKIFHVPSPRGWASTRAPLLFVGGAPVVKLRVVSERLGGVYDAVRRRA